MPGKPPLSFTSRFNIGDVVTYKHQRCVVEYVKFSAGKVAYGLYIAPNAAEPIDIFETPREEALSEDVYPEAAHAL